jgi:hypothetical protein
VSQNGWLLSRRGRSLPANASALGTHRDSMWGGGRDNTATAAHTTVAGGFSNDATAASARYAALAGELRPGELRPRTCSCGGGSSNLASGAHASVAGGESGTASGAHASIGGGQSNAASSAYAVVGGGANNAAAGYSAAGYNTVGGGRQNQATVHDYITIGGGKSNQASAVSPFLAWIGSPCLRRCVHGASIGGRDRGGR